MIEKAAETVSRLDEKLLRVEGEKEDRAKKRGGKHTKAQRK